MLERSGVRLVFLDPSELSSPLELRPSVGDAGFLRMVAKAVRVRREPVAFSPLLNRRGLQGISLLQ